MAFTSGERAASVKYKVCLVLAWIFGMLWPFSLIFECKAARYKINMLKKVIL